MSGIIANSVSRTMLAAETAVDKSVSGFLALEEVTLSVTPTGTSYVWGIAKPSYSTARAVLSSTTDASPTFTPDVGGYFTLTCVVDSTTTYVIRIAVNANAEISTLDAIRFLPIADVSVPAPATGRTVYSSSDAAALVQKLPDGLVYPMSVGASTASANVAGLKAISAAELAALVDGQSFGYATTLRSWYVWDAASTDADDTTDFLILSVTANGVAAGRWRRLLSLTHPAWLAQAAWFVDTAGSNENDGATSLTPVKTDAEIQRRLGSATVISIPVSVTYAQAPVGVTNYDVQIPVGGSLTLIGTPTVSKSGLVISAVQAQVRTAGSEAAWAITEATLGASDVGKLAVITASGTPANVGAYARILKDETAGKVRVSPFGTFAVTDISCFVAVTPLVGDVISVVTPMTINAGLIRARALHQTSTAAAPTRNCVVFDSILFEGSATAFNGTIEMQNIAAFFARSIGQNMSFTGVSASSSLIRICGGGITGCTVRGPVTVQLRQTGVTLGTLGGVTVANGALLSVLADTYFQNSRLTVGQGGQALTLGAAFFDRSTSNSALVVEMGGVAKHIGGTADWGTNNTGHGVTVQSLGGYTYVTKPTINSGLGAGREAQVGGTDKLWSAIPYVEATNNAALVLTA